MTTIKPPLELETYFADIRTAVENCFDKDKFDHTCEYTLKECTNTYGNREPKEPIECIDVRVSGLKGIQNFQIRQCLYFSIVPQKEEGRTYFKTSFWVQVHDFRTCAPRRGRDYGQIEYLMKLMISFTQTLDSDFQGEFCLQVLHDTTTWEDDNNFEGIDMRLLHVLEHGQSRLNELEIYEPQYAKNRKKLEEHLGNLFTLQLPPEMHKSFKSFLNLMKLTCPTNKQMFVAVAARLSILNDAWEDGTFVDENKIEIELFRQLLRAEQERPFFKSMFQNLMLKQDGVERKAPVPVLPLVEKNLNRWPGRNLWPKI